MSAHKHHFHALWWTLGQFGRQDVHLHPCERQSCQTEMVGPGKNCDGDRSTHVPKTLTERSAWSKKAAEGTPLSGSQREGSDD